MESDPSGFRVGLSAFFGNHVNPRASNIVAGKKTKRDAEVQAPHTIAFDDAALVERSGKGDMQAFGALVTKYQDRIFNMILRMSGNRADAEELAQETFLKALTKINQFRGQSGFYTWLFRIAINLTTSYRRRSSRIKFQSLCGQEESDRPRADVLKAAGRGNPNPAAAAISAETGRMVAEALEGLDEEFRLVVVLRDVEEMDYAQIARVLELPVGTVKSRLHRARCILKERLKDLVG